MAEGERTKTVKFRILRPVNPDGISFVKYCWGALIGQLGEEYMRKNRREISRLIQKLGFKLDELSEGGVIEGDIGLILEDNKPARMYAENIKIYTPTKEIKERVEVSL